MAIDIGELRRSQLITTYGCGAIVDLPGESVIMAGIEYWRNQDDERFRLSEPNLQKLLRKEYFVTPPPTENESGYPTGYRIPAFRFPKWMYCPQCKRLAPAATFGFVNKPRCERCQRYLIPSRFVIACENGHLEDFPYMWWVHYGAKCSGNRPPELYIEMSEQSSGLDSIIIECRSCKNKRSMQGSFINEALKGLKCRGNRPWLKDKDPVQCDKMLRTMQRGATNLHFGINISTLSIPPWSKQIQIAIGNRWQTVKCYLHDETLFKSAIPPLGILEQCGCSIEELWQQAKLFDENASDTGAKSWQSILEEEYQAFLTGSDDEEGEFKTREVEVPSFVSPYIEKVVLALRIREVMALRGFRRIDPEYDIDDNASYTPVSREEQKWLPAIELKGEGLFIKLNREKLVEWENKPEVKTRFQTINPAKGDSLIKGPGFSPRYVLLHTLAHHLIRQLILQCGYSSASIKERIYCTFINKDPHLQMEGILIYTASNDSEGSLGGLVREGKKERLDNTFRNMLESASWCSADPLCINSRGQGLNALNLAACHSCTLLPETSCEARNCYLDRAALIGTLDNKSIGFFHSLLDYQE